MRKIMLAWTALALLSQGAAASDGYRVSVTRKDRNLYKVDAQPYWVKTRYCYEYSYGEDAFLTPYTLNFLDSSSECDVKLVLKEVSVPRGNYELSVSHEDDDFYSTLDGLYIQTSLCLHLALGEKAIFLSSGFGSGTLLFTRSQRKCSVERIFERVRL